MADGMSSRARVNGHEDALDHALSSLPREDLAKDRPANAPDAPTHASLLAARESAPTEEGVRA
ncbi:hypothetical protein BSZ07_38110 [Streptomyces sp. M1013]|nr:hypothetical protein BSZ07_38110 [Streptomyces sp. M1013]